MPCSGPRPTPAISSRSASADWTSASSSVTGRKLCSLPSCAAIRASSAFVTSTGDNSRCVYSRANSAIVKKAGSIAALPHPVILAARLRPRRTARDAIPMPRWLGFNSTRYSGAGSCYFSAAVAEPCRLERKPCLKFDTRDRSNRRKSKPLQPRAVPGSSRPIQPRRVYRDDPTGPPQQGTPGQR